MVLGHLGASPLGALIESPLGVRGREAVVAAIPTRVLWRMTRDATSPNEHRLSLFDADSLDPISGDTELQNTLSGNNVTSFVVRPDPVGVCVAATVINPDFLPELRVYDDKGVELWTADLDALRTDINENVDPTGVLWLDDGGTEIVVVALVWEGMRRVRLVAFVAATGATHYDTVLSIDKARRYWSSVSVDNVAYVFYSDWTVIGSPDQSFVSEVSASGAVLSETEIVPHFGEPGGTGAFASEGEFGSGVWPDLVMTPQIALSFKSSPGTLSARTFNRDTWAEDTSQIDVTVSGGNTNPLVPVPVDVDGATHQPGVFFAAALSGKDPSSVLKFDSAGVQVDSEFLGGDARNHAATLSLRYQKIAPRFANRPDITEFADRHIDDEAPYVEQLTYTPVAGDAPALWDLLTFPSGATIDASTGEVTWPTPVAGSTSTNRFRARVRTSLTLQDEFDWGVRVADTAPVLEQPPDETVFVTQEYEVSVAVDNSGVTGVLPVTWELVSAPSDATLSTFSSSASVSWLSPVVGEHLFTLRATNPKGADQVSWTVTGTDDPTEAPVIDPVADHSHDSSSGNYFQQVTLSSGNVITWSLVQAPAGVALFFGDDDGVLVFWDGPVPGVYTITVRAENTLGFDDESWQLTVT